MESGSLKEDEELNENLEDAGTQGLGFGDWCVYCYATLRSAMNYT